MEMKEEWLMPGAVVPVDAETTAALVAEIKRLIGVVGDMALNMQPAQQQKEGFASPGGGYVPAIPRPMPLDWKLVPRKATPEMLRAMDECAQEGYDERLYEGMASSVYMAAWDASPVMGTLPEQSAQQQEPFGYFRYDPRLDAWVQNREGRPGTPFYTSPQPSKPWVGLTRDERMDIINRFAGQDWVYAVEAIETKLREKNA